MNWLKLKSKTEKRFENATIRNCWGYQIQKGTKWNQGLEETQIKDLEELWGLKFPNDYFKMLKWLKWINGFNKPQISIDPDRITPDRYDRRCYKYPEDYAKVKWLIEELKENISYAKAALEENGFDSEDLEGFIPLYGHRALVVLKDKNLSPVISAIGSDIIEVV